MKSIKYLMISFLAAGAMVACTENHDFDPTPQESGAGVYISSDINTSVQVPDGSTEFTFAVSRMNSEGELTVGLEVSQSEDAFFTVPYSVSFADGENDVEVKVTFVAEDLEYDVAYPLQISLDDPDNTSLYAKSTITFSVVHPGPWKTLGWATYTDDFVTTFWGVKNVPYQVEIQAGLLEKDWGTFRLVNPYGEAYPYNEDGDWDTSTDYYLYIHTETALNPDSEGFATEILNAFSDRVWLGVQDTGMDWGYGNFYVSDIAGYYYERGRTFEEIDEYAEEDGLDTYFGKLDKGIITFPKASMLCAMLGYNGGGLYTANTNGAFRVVFPGVKLGNYSVTAELAGFFNDVEDNWFAVADVTLGKNVEYALAASAAGSDADALYDAIVAGEVETVTLDASGKVNLPIGEGTSTIVVVTYDADGAPQEYDYITFKHYSGTVTVSPLDEEWTVNDIYEIEKEDLFKTWVMWGYDYFGDGMEREPFAYWEFSENTEDDDEDDDFDAINVNGLSFGFFDDDTNVWEYYEGFVYQLYDADEAYFGVYGGYDMEWVVYDDASGALGGMSYALIGGLVDDGYMAFVNGGGDYGYNFRGIGLYITPTSGDDQGGLYYFPLDIMLQDAALIEPSAAKASVRRNAGLSELKTLAQNMAPAKNFVELRGRERAHALIDELKADKKAAGPKEEFEILSWKNNPNAPAKGVKPMKQQSASAVVAL